METLWPWDVPILLRPVSLMDWSNWWHSQQTHTVSLPFSHLKKKRLCGPLVMVRLDRTRRRGFFFFCFDRFMLVSVKAVYLLLSPWSARARPSLLHWHQKRLVLCTWISLRVGSTHVSVERSEGSSGWSLLRLNESFWPFSTLLLMLSAKFSLSQLMGTVRQWLSGAEKAPSFTWTWGTQIWLPASSLTEIH